MVSNTKNPIDDLFGDLHSTNAVFAPPSFPPAGCLAATYLLGGKLGGAFSGAVTQD